MYLAVRLTSIVCYETYIQSRLARLLHLPAAKFLYVLTGRTSNCQISITRQRCDRGLYCITWTIPLDGPDPATPVTSLPIYAGS